MVPWHNLHGSMPHSTAVPAHTALPHLAVLGEKTREDVNEVGPIVRETLSTIATIVEITCSIVMRVAADFATRVCGITVSIRQIVYHRRRGGGGGLA